MSLNLDRQNTYRQRYASMTAGWQPATHVYERLIRQYAQPDDVLLDMGCGRGGVLEQLTDLPLYAIGVDPDTLSLQEHRQPQLPRATADATALPLRDACCNVVISAWVLEHLPQPETAFREIGRVLKKGGVFISLTPNKHSPIALLNRTLKPLQSHLVPLLYGRAEADTFPVVYQANTPDAIANLATQAGMTLHETHLIHDPTYLAFNEALFRLNVLATRLTPASMGVHLLTVCMKK